MSIVQTQQIIGPGGGGVFVEKNRTATFAVDASSNHGAYRGRSITSSGDHNFTFVVPAEFDALISIELYGIPESSFTSQDIDLDSNYGGLGENYQTHVEADHTGTYSGVINSGFSLDLSSVFSALSAGDRCGVLVDHNVIGDTINYLMIVLNYTVA